MVTFTIAQWNIVISIFREISAHRFHSSSHKLINPNNRKMLGLIVTAMCELCFLTIDNGHFWQQNCAEMYNVSVPLVSDDLNTDISIIWVRLPALTAAAVTTLADGSSAPRAKTSHNHCSVCLTTHTHSSACLALTFLCWHICSNPHTHFKKTSELPCWLLPT